MMYVKLNDRWVYGMGLMVLLLGVGLGSRDNQKVVVKEEEPLGELSQQEDTVENFIPLIKDTHWTYQINTDEDNLFKAHIDYARENIFQVSLQSDYTHSVKVYTYDEVGFYEVATLEGTSQKMDYTMTRQYKKPLLKMPITLGDTWVVSEDITAEVIQKDEQGLQISYATEANDKVVTVYYEEKIGPSHISILKDHKHYYLALEEMEQGTPVQELVTVYYMNTATQEMEKMIQDVAIMTNEDPKHFLTDLLKRVPDDTYHQTLANDTMIQKIYLDQEDSRVYIDLNQTYNDAHATQTDKLFSLKSLAYTVGNYYDAKAVSLSIEGEPYPTLIPIYDKETGILLEK